MFPAIRHHDQVPPPPQSSSEEEDDGMRSNPSNSLFSPSRSVMTTATSYTASTRSSSPAPSLISMTPAMQAAAFKMAYGRGLNNYSDVYGLPADDEELDRLDRQHLLFIDIMGKYPPPIRYVLGSALPGEDKYVLDLGCGSGSWIMEVARDFPNSSCVAVDLVPMQSAIMPPNCRSEVDDLNLGLEHFYGDFDFVHGRLISSGIKDYARLIHHIAHILRPNGLIELMEFDFHVYDHNYHRVEAPVHVVDKPWWPRWLAFAEMTINQRGGSPDAAYHLHRWVATHGAFEDVVYQDHWIPTSPWSKCQPWKHWGEEMQADILAFLLSGRPLLLGSGVPESLVDELESNAREEVLAASQITFIRLQRVFARKRADYNVPP
ncbi:hypothetical protein ONZ45_g2562 [Pleurotus djamor]|nr:hypothetical protein ONZ45_g2562 [Pleurotus djamor]